LRAIIKRFICEKDKQQHIFVCASLALLFSYWFQAEVIIIMVSLIGLGKEIWDHYYGTGFCWYDMMANAIGLGFALILLKFF